VATLQCEVVTAERVVFSGQVDIVVAPGIEGTIGVLPRHTPLLTALKVGELRLKLGSDEIAMAVTGGFIEVLPTGVTVLATAAERAEEIDVSRAEQARRRAEERLADQKEHVDVERAEAALRRSLIRLKVAQQFRTKPRKQ
jgi:F-type H+-transporting ATPase subunit epsilon